MVTNLIIMEHTEDASAPANVPPASPSIAPLRNLTRQSSFSLATSEPPAGPPGPVDDGTPASPLAPLLGAREELSSKKRNLKPNNTGLKIAPAATPSEISNASEGGGGQRDLRRQTSKVQKWKHSMTSHHLGHEVNG